MNQAFNQFKNFLTPFGLIESDVEKMIQFCDIVYFRKGEVVIQEGSKNNHIYFICNGIVRNYVLTFDGEVSTYGFRTENMLITGYGIHNIHDDQRALVSVECLEKCELIKIPLSALQFMEANSKDAHKVARYIAEAHIIDLVKFVISADTKSLKERYEELENIFPNIHQRVPQHIIAAYLRISRVHLSRIKKMKVKL
jgi:signal-transduction protein with cAMP-binding, CBS, and nucleotidyltransferase domain